jgi:hypothetical protein
MHLARAFIIDINLEQNGNQINSSPRDLNATRRRDIVTIAIASRSKP